MDRAAGCFTAKRSIEMERHAFARWLMPVIPLYKAREADPGRLPARHHGLFQAEVIWSRRPWKNLDAVEYATLEWVDWFNNRRLLEPIGDIPPAEFEQAYYDQLEGQAIAA